MRPLKTQGAAPTRWITRALLVAAILISPGLSGFEPSTASAQDGFDDESEGFDAGEQYYSRATRYVRFKGFSKAMKFFKKALPFMNEESDIYYNLVGVAEAMGHHEEIFLYGKAFLRLEPDSLDAREVRYKVMKAESTLKASRKAPAQVRFEVDPPGTLLFVNDVPVGVSGGPPISLPAGTFTVQGTIDDYHPFKKTFEVNPRTPMTITGAFEKIKYYGKLNVITYEAPCAWPCTALQAALDQDDKTATGLKRAEGVRVYIDDTLMGKTPMDDLKMLSNRYLIRFERDGWDSWSRYINIGRNDTLSIQPILEKTATASATSKRP
jgi:tetratricopeptide (TPR) repeat protein